MKYLVLVKTVVFEDIAIQNSAILTVLIQNIITVVNSSFNTK